MAHILCAGEALIDSIHHDSGTTHHVGGSLLNVALGISRQGITTTLASAWADDEFGHMIEDKLSDVITPAENRCLDRTNVAHARLDEEGKATYEFDLINEIPHVSLDNITHLHIGSIGAFLEPGRSTSLDLARNGHDQEISVSYDINARPTLMGNPDQARPMIEEVIACSTIVKASDDDVAWLWPGAAIDDVARQWLDAGPTLAIITLGGEGTLVVGTTWEKAVIAQPRKVSVADTVGAGDSFMAGFLADMSHAGNLGTIPSDPATIMASVNHAMTTAAITVTHAGAYAPTRDEVIGFSSRK